MKALRLPIHASAVAYWFAPAVHALRPQFVFDTALLEGGRLLQGPGLVVPAARSAGSCAWARMGSLRSPGDPSRTFALLLGACPRNRLVLLAKEARIKFRVWHEQDIPALEDR